MKKLLMVSGALTLAVLAMPWLVLLGFLMLIIPGLVLMIVPTFFGYLLATAIIRPRLPIAGQVPATVVAAIAAVALGGLLAQPARLEAYVRYKLAQKDDIVPPAPIVPRGHIRLERPRMLGSNYRCDALCAALLATPGVASVTIAEADDRGVTTQETLRLAPKGSVPDVGFRPNSVSTFRAYTARDGHKQREADDKALAASWALRLATSETLVAGPPRTAFDMTIAMIDSPRGGPKVERVEVARGETVLLRRSLVSHTMLAAPLHAMLDGGPENMRWGWGRSTLSTGARYASFKHQDELLAHLALAAPRADHGSPAELRKRLVAALDAPGAPAELGLASPWLESFGYNALEGADIAIVARILADPRITDLEYFHKTHEKKGSVALRGAIAKRILMPNTSQEDRRRLGRLLKAMPEGTFAVPTEDERTILSQFRYQCDAAPFIERLADQGPSAIAPLLQILETAARLEPYAKRERMVIAARRGLARLGPAARPALPTVLRLFSEEPNQLAGDWRDSQEWRVAMVRMGLDPRELPWSAHTPADQIARERANVERAVKERDATWEGG